MFYLTILFLVNIIFGVAVLSWACFGGAPIPLGVCGVFNIFTAGMLFSLIASH
jgi:hypothetical protein